MTENKLDVLIDIFGKDSPPSAAKFGTGVKTLAEINEATSARRNATPGSYLRTDTEAQK